MSDKTKYMIVIVIVLVIVLICVSSERFSEMSDEFGGVNEIDDDYYENQAIHSSDINTAFMNYDYNPYSSSGYVHPRAKQSKEFNDYYPSILAPVNVFPGTRMGVNTYLRANHPNKVILDSEYAKVMAHENTESMPVSSRNASWV